MLRLDDPLDAIAVHAWNGTWGLIAPGLFSAQTLIQVRTFLSSSFFFSIVTFSAFSAPFPTASSFRCASSSSPPSLRCYVVGHRHLSKVPSTHFVLVYGMTLVLPRQCKKAPSRGSRCGKAGESVLLLSSSKSSPLLKPAVGVWRADGQWPAPYKIWLLHERRLRQPARRTAR